MIDASSSSTTYEQYFHNNFITTYATQFMNHTSTHFHKLHRKIYFNKLLIHLHHNKLSDKLVIHSSIQLQHNFNTSHTSSQQLFQHSFHTSFNNLWNNSSSHLQHKHFNNASWFFIINIHDNKWVTFFDKHLMIHTQSFIRNSSFNLHSTIIVTKFHSTFIQQL